MKDERARRRFFRFAGAGLAGFFGASAAIAAGKPETNTQTPAIETRACPLCGDAVTRSDLAWECHDCSFVYYDE